MPLITRLYRFLVLQRKITQHLTPDRFKFVPMLDMTRSWTDGDLYDYFGLTEEERMYVESTIAPREVNWTGIDSPNGIPTSHLPGGSKYRPGKVEDESEEGDE